MSSSEPDSGSRASRVVTLGVILGACALALTYAFYFVFSRSMSLDEGYLMITIQGFNAGHALYDEVFTQYGPFYYFYEWLLRTVLMIPLTHDATRLLCVAHWVVASALLGGAAWRLTSSGLAAVFVSVQAFVHLSLIANEPGHPQGLVVLLLALGVLAASHWSRNRWSLELLAGLAAVIAFTKINVGAFFVFALLLTVAGESTRLARGLWKWPAFALCAALPFLLMRHHLTAEWCRNFAVLAASATVATLLVRPSTAAGSTISPKKYLTAGAVFIAISALWLTLTLATGTSWRGLVDGLLLTPLKMPHVALLPIALPNATWLNAFAALAVAGILVWKKNDSRIPAFITGLKGLYAVVGAFCLVGQAHQQLAFLLPWVWLVVVPRRNSGATTHDGFARGFLAIAAAWQSLQAYPIAGTQVSLATFLLVLTYGVCLADALAALASLPRMQLKFTSLTPASRLLGGALAGTTVLYLLGSVWCDLSAVRREYARLLPLELPGSRFVRMNEEMTTMNQELARYLARECDTFVSYPGINSLYFWAGKKPPTQINSTGWGQLTHAQQRHILSSLQQARRPKLVVTEAMMSSWGTPYADPIRPLIRFVTEECRPVKRIGRCLIFEPKSTAPLSATPP